MAPDPIRLLNVVPTLMCGGTENQFMALARAVDRRRFDLEFACLRRWGGFVSEIDERRIPLREYGISSFYSAHAVVQQARLARHIRKRRTQIVHAYNFYGNVFGLPPARAAGARVVIASIRDRGAYLTPMQKYVQRHICRLADCVLVNADSVREWLIGEGYNPATIAVIRNGVDLRRFKQPPDTARVRRELGIPDGSPMVTVVSRLNRLKGIEYFLEAAVAVSARFPKARFLVVGETNPSEQPYLSELQALAGRLGVADRVIFTGLRTDTPDILGASTVSVMPSLNEALSNVLLESMAAGTPVVATRVGGTPEAVEEGVNGLLVPPAHAGALANAINILLAEPELAASWGHAGREIIAQRFSMDRMVHATEQLYLTLLEKRRRHVGSESRELQDPMTTVEIIGDRKAFLAMEAEWNDAVERAAIPHPFLRHEWIRTWFDCFGGHARLQIVVVRSGRTVRAIAPLMFETGTMYGVPVRRLRLMHNDQTPRADLIVCGDADEPLRAIWRTLIDMRRQWDVLQIGQLPRESGTRSILTGLAGEAKCATGVWHSGASPFIELRGTWEAYQASLGAKFRANVRNRLARLKQLGEPSFELVADPAAVDAACRDVLRIEAAAWKLEEGTAIASDAAVARLYRMFAREAAARGWLRLFFLTVNGRRIATSYSLEYRRRLFLFKTGYDPAFAKCSPFKVLTHFILQHGFESRLEEVDFLGDPEPWKLEWTPLTRPHDWLFVFSSSLRARLLHPVKFQVVPALRRCAAAASVAG